MLRLKLCFLDSQGASAHKSFCYSLFALPVLFLTGFYVLPEMRSRHFLIPQTTQRAVYYAGKIHALD